MLCFEVGILGGISTAWYRLIGTVGLGQHLWLYSNRALEQLLERSELTIEKIKYFGLAPEVAVGRAIDIFSNRMLKPVLNLARPLRIFPSPEAAVELQSSTRNFLRYRVGNFAPRIGPQTVFVVARPKRHAAAT